MMRHYDIVVVGAGITGLTMAALLATSKHSDRLRVTLVDQGERPVHQADDEVALRVSSIAAGSVELIDALGAWSVVADIRVCPYERMRVWDWSEPADGPATLRFDAADFALPQLGFIVENSLLQQALLDVLDNTDVELRFAAPIADLESKWGGYRLTFEGGNSLYADLVIGADGARSLVRDRVGIETSVWSYEQTALVTHVRPERSHQRTAWQRFLKEGPLGMLPLADGRVSVVWTTTDTAARHALSATDRVLSRELTAASDSVLGELRVAGPRGVFSLQARHAQQYVKSGVALIGDAAHSVHPLAGQGANLGLQDAVKLADIIDSALDNGESPADRPVLRRYERARKGANTTMLHFLTGLNRLFANDSVLVRELRTTGMRLFNHSGPIRNHAVKVALGMSARR